MALTSPRVKAVMSHCSIEGVSAALSEALPIIGLPLRGNQPGTCVLAQNMGAASCYLYRRPIADEEAQGQERVDHLAKELQQHIYGVMFDPVTAPQYQQQAVRAQRVMQFGGGGAKGRRSGGDGLVWWLGAPTETF